MVVRLPSGSRSMLPGGSDIHPTEDAPLWTGMFWVLGGMTRPASSTGRATQDAGRWLSTQHVERDNGALIDRFRRRVHFERQNELDLGSERLGQPEQGRGRRRYLPALDPADVRLRDAASVCEVSLTKTPCLPRAVDDLAELVGSPEDAFGLTALRAHLGATLTGVLSECLGHLNSSVRVYGKEPIPTTAFSASAWLRAPGLPSRPGAASAPPGSPLPTWTVVSTLVVAMEEKDDLLFLEGVIRCRRSP